MSDDEYRTRAEKERQNLVKSFEKSLLSDKNDTAATVAADVRHSRRDTAAFLRSVGMSAKKSKWFAEQYPHISSDEQAKRAVKAIVGVSRADGGIHKGHRKRMRASAKTDSELEVFSDVEILELMLSFFVPQRDTNPLAHRLLDKYGSLLAVFRTPAEELANNYCMTVNAAKCLSMLSAICLWDGRREVRFRDAGDVASFFGSVYLGGEARGIYAAFLDGGFSLIAIEKTDEKQLEMPRALIGSMCKYDARYLVICVMNGDPFPGLDGLRECAARFSRLFSGTRARLLDIMVFCEYGYYTLGSTPFGEGYSFEFVLSDIRARSPELMRKGRQLGDFDIDNR